MVVKHGREEEADRNLQKVVDHVVESASAEVEVLACNDRSLPKRRVSRDAGRAASQRKTARRTVEGRDERQTHLGAEDDGNQDQKLGLKERLEELTHDILDRRMVECGELGAVRSEDGLGPSHEQERNQAPDEGDDCKDSIDGRGCARAK